MTTIQRTIDVLEPFRWSCDLTQRTINGKRPGRQRMVFFRDAYRCVDFLGVHRAFPFTLLGQGCGAHELDAHLEKCCLADREHGLTAAAPYRIPLRDGDPPDTPRMAVSGVRCRRLIVFEHREAGRGDARGWVLHAQEVLDGAPAPRRFTGPAAQVLEELGLVLPVLG